MKRIFFILLAIVFFGSFVYADTRQKPTTIVYTSSTLVRRGDAKIYHIDYIITSNGGGWAVYDALDGQSEANIKTERQEATANNSDSCDFTLLRGGGLELSTGLYLHITNASVVITYD